MDDYSKLFANKNVVMVVTAHPDDLDAMCGGTVARLTSEGKQVISVKTTTGNNGSRDKAISPAFLAKKRDSEDAKAMKILGIRPEHNINLGLDDGSIENNKDLIERISYYIRKFQPDIIITLNPQDLLITGAQGKTWVNHRDHRNTAGATLDAAYPFSRDLSFFSSHFEDVKIKPSKCNDVLFADYYAGSGAVSVKIDDFLPQKLAALECHVSQFDKQTAKKVLEMYSPKQKTGTFEAFRHVSFA